MPTRSRNLHINPEARNQPDVHNGATIFFGHHLPNFANFFSFACVVLSAEVSKAHAIVNSIYEGTGRNDSAAAESSRWIYRSSDQEDAKAALRIFAYNGNLQRAE